MPGINKPLFKTSGTCSTAKSSHLKRKRPKWLKKSATEKPTLKTCLTSSSKKANKTKRNPLNSSNWTTKSKSWKRKSRLQKTKSRKTKPNCLSSKRKSHKLQIVTKTQKPSAKDSKSWFKNVKRLMDLCHRLPPKNQTKLTPPKTLTKNSTAKPSGCNANSKWWRKLL